MNLQERITNKEIQIGKLVAKFDRYSREASEEFLSIVNQFLRTGDRTKIHEYFKTHSQWSTDYDLYRTASDLFDSRITLQKYNQQLKDQQNREATLNQLPETLVEFKNNLIKHWDEFDLYKRSRIKELYREAEKLPLSDYREATHKIRSTWGANWYQFMHLSDTEIHKNNVKDSEALILNLIDRVITKCGQIINTDGLYLNRDNSGYTIINGTITGTSGTAKIESIGAGGYNIQRYHIRVLVK